MLVAATTLATGFMIGVSPAANAVAKTANITVPGAPQYSAGNTQSLSSINPTITNGETGYSLTSVTWSPSDTNVAANTTYSVAVVLNADAGNTFATPQQAQFTGAGMSRFSTAMSSISNSSTTLTITITFIGSSASGNVNNNLPATTATSSNVTDTSITVDWATLAAAHSSVTTWRVYVRDRSVSPSVLIGYYDVAGSVHSLTVTGLNAGTQYNFFMADLGSQLYNGFYTGFEPGLNVTTTGGGSGNSVVSLTPAQILAAATAAAEAAKAAAEAKRAAVISEARAALISTITSGNPATFDQLAKSNFKVIDTKSMDKVNAAIAKLDVKSSDFNAKLAEAVEKINYTDTFFDPKQPATKEAVAAYGVAASDFALKLINSESAKAGIEKLPDFTAMKELINKVTIVEKVVAPTATTSLSTGDLIRANLITTETKYKTTVLSGLKSSGASISSVADLEAAIKAQEKLAADRYARTRAIVAKIASNK